MKERLDVLLTAGGFCTSRERSRNRIIAGDVTVNGRTVTKPGTMVSEEDHIELSGEDMRYVGRGGYKLEKVLTDFSVQLTGRTCIDVGASTGGFTDCMLQHGAAKVYAIDVGTDQLAESLRADERVVSMEQTNIREVTPEMLSGEADFLAADVSFISLTKVLPIFRTLVREGGQIACLIKPQFEAGKALVGKHGVVKDRRAHRTVITEVMQCAVSCGFSVDGLCYSPICGQNGNIEYLFLATRNEMTNPMMDTGTIERIVNEAFLHHGK